MDDYDSELVDGKSYPHLDDGDIFTIIIKDQESYMARAHVVLTWMTE